MRRSSTAIFCAIALCTLALAGCGSSSSSKSNTIAQVEFKSSAITSGSIPVRFTCAGGDSPPPLEWGAVPPSTGSLVLFILAITPEPSTSSYALSVAWAVAGIKPGLHKLTAGQLPPRADIGINSEDKRRYSICPPKGMRAQYDFELYGLPSSEAVAPDFGALSVYRTLAARSSPVNAHGRFVAVYERR